MTDRVWCSHGIGNSRWTEHTADVITGPECPRHRVAMHRAPAPPRDVAHWVCHGYDGEGCDEIGQTPADPACAPVTRAA